MGFVDLGKYGWATRDCPNVIIPSLVDAPLLGAAYLTSSWGGWPANYRQIIASTAEEYLVSHAFLGAGLGSTVTANGLSAPVNHMHLLIGKGAAGAETIIAEAAAASSVIFQMSGIVDDAVSCLLWETMTHLVSLAPVIVPAASRLAAKGQVSSAPTQKRGGIYLTGYPTRALCYAHVPAFDELFMRGLRPVYSDVQPLTAPVTITGHANIWTLGAWVQIPVGGAALDDDYLFDWATATGGALSKSAQFEIGLGPDIDHIVIQARYAVVASLYPGSADDELPLPFIAYKGEKVWVRLAEQMGGGITYDVCLHAKRFN